MYFRRNLSQSVETISATSNFDGYSESKYTKKGRQHFGDFFLVSYLFRIQNQLLGFHLFASHRKLYLSWLIACSQYHEGRTLKEIALNGLLQLGLSDMKFIRCDVSIIHRHDIRIALYTRHHCPPTSPSGRYDRTR